MNFTETKLRSGRKLFPAKIALHEGRYYFKFRFNRALMNDLKRLSGAKWHGYDNPPMKCWSILDNEHNRFQLDYLKGNNPYSIYDSELQPIESERPLMSQQIEMASHILARRQCIIAGEMGTGKSLAGIEVMERSGFDDWWWVSSKSAIKSVQLELSKWKSRVKPRLLTYDNLKKVIKEWDGEPAPRGVFFDESARIKNRTSQRSQAAAHLAQSIREEYGEDGYVICMSGSPAPKAPTDWWNQAEVARPGFLVEGDEAKLRYRLCLIENKESMHGGSYPHLITWYDNPDKCKKCGQLAESHDLTDPDSHDFAASTDEISFLYERLKGLVIVKLKKDCMDLPDKIYRPIIIEPSKSTLRTAQALAASATSTIKALTLLRELSDGFQYRKVKAGEETCGLCNGAKIIPVPKEAVADGEDVEWVDDCCPNCSGTGSQTKYERDTDYVNCPKIEVIRDLMEEHEDGRMVVYAGFTGSINLLCDTFKEKKWWVIRIDGTSWHLTNPEGDRVDDFDSALQAMDNGYPDIRELKIKFPKLAVIGHPASGSEGLTFTASPSIIYYSNDFNGMYRLQSEDRIHRKGMDTNIGATIIDLYHLPTDEYVKRNLDGKKKLQAITMGAIVEALSV